MNRTFNLVAAPAPTPPDRKVSTAMLAAVFAGLLGLPLAGLADDASSQGLSSQQMVARDAKTGQLRAPTLDERKALQQARSGSQLSDAQTSLRDQLPRRVFRHSSGALGVEGSADVASYVVVARQPDGKLVEACVDSKSQANQIVQTGVMPVAPQQAPSK